jgi:hypothetical protein
MIPHDGRLFQQEAVKRQTLFSVYEIAVTSDFPVTLFKKFLPRFRKCPTKGVNSYKLVLVTRCVKF